MGKSKDFGLLFCQFFTCTISRTSFLLIALNVASRVRWREGLWKHEWHFCWSLRQDVLAEHVATVHHHHETKESISKILPTWRNCHWLDEEQYSTVSDMLPGSLAPLLYLLEHYSYHMLPFFQCHQSISHSNWYHTDVPVANSVINNQRISRECRAVGPISFFMHHIHVQLCSTNRNETSW